VKRGRDITWSLRALPAPEWVMEQWPGSATIIAVRSHGIREGMATLAHDIKGLLRLLGWREPAEEEPPIG
jgi:hypothetical protein